jgi:UDP-3-O-[3-hydroxymyristoyl] glucosamine N-acyltransferase
VEIGAGCTINKGVSGDTVIGEGTKLDCQVHIGHDVVIGKRCLIAAQVGIGGNTRIGDEVVLYGQVGIAQNLVIGERAVILAKSGVSKNLPPGKTYFGYPAGEARGMYRELAALRHLPDFLSKYYKR